jgi:hypothetical protein
MVSKERLSRWYTITAIIVLNTLIVFLILNVIVWGVGRVDESTTELATPDPRDVYIPSAKLTVQSINFDALRQFYYYRTDPEIFRLLLEGMGLAFECDPDTIFRVKPRAGNYYNVDAAGFRVVSPQGVWPPAKDGLTIFVFGGSTTYGAGVADNLTIPSWLQDHLRTALGRDDLYVYNFGVPSFTSVQERWRFEALLRDGFVPDLAIFIDGVNDFVNYNSLITVSEESQCEPPLSFSSRLSNTLSCSYDELCFPIQRFATALDARQASSAAEDFQERAGFVPEPEAPPDDEAANQRVIERWLENKQAIEQAAQGITTVFVMQPTAAYAYDLAYHPLIEAGGLDETRFVWGYALWEERFAEAAASWAQNTLNLTRLGEDNQGPIYLDSVHYTSDFSNEIAQAISDAIIARDLLNRNAGRGNPDG